MAEDEKKQDRAKMNTRGGHTPPPAQQQEQQTKGTVQFTRGCAARVEDVMGRTGTRGEAIQVRCKILEGRDENKILRRNVKGPIRPGDILMLRETEIESRPLNKKSRGGV